MSETYLDEDNRLLFHNASEYAELYPDAVAAPAAYYAPRSEEGYEVDAVRRRIALRAGLIDGNAASAGKLRGCVERVSENCITGWAQDADHPEAAVCLDIYADGRPIGQVLANRYRSDLKSAGFGRGLHGFEFTPPVELAFDPDSVEVCRALDAEKLGRRLPPSIVVHRRVARAS